MVQSLGNVNFLAVVVVAVVTFLIGGAWYTALFGKLWVQLHGYSEEKVKEMQAKRPPALFFGGMLAAYFVIALAVALLVTHFNMKSVGEGLAFGFVLWIGPAVGIAFTSFLASDKPFGVYAIDLGYQLIFLLLMGSVFAVWR